MKKSFIKSAFVAIAATFVATASFAVEPPSVKALEKFAYSAYAPQGQKKIRMAFENGTGEAISVRIYDQSNRLVYSEKLKNIQQMRRDYVFADDLASGVYRVDLRAGEFTGSSTLGVGTAAYKKFSAYVSPKIMDGAIKVAYDGNSEGVYLSITDANGAVIYSEQTGNQSSFARRYDLSQLPKGKYRLLVLHGNESIEQTYEVK